MVVVFSKASPPEGVCKGYVLGKHHQAPFDSRKSWTEHNLLELIHNDVCFINLPSLVDESYILTCIDDFSHFTWVLFLKNKNLVFWKFQGDLSLYWKSMWSTHEIPEIKKWWWVCQSPFEEYLDWYHIDWQWSVPHTP